MNTSITLQIMTPGRRQKFEDVASLTLLLIDGSIGILPGHAPLLAETAAGTVHFRKTNGEEIQQFLPTPGILQVKSENVTIFLHGMEAESSHMPARLLQETLAAFEMDGDHAKEG